MEHPNDQHHTSPSSGKSQRRQRVPALKFTDRRKIGWHANYRDPVTGKPTRIRFGNVTKQEAQLLYHRWLVEHLEGKASQVNDNISRPKHSTSTPSNSETPIAAVSTATVPGSLVEIATGLLRHEEARTRQPGEPRRAGTIDPRVLHDRKQHLHGFLAFINAAHGEGAVGRLTVADLTMADVESFNRELVDAGLSATQVSKRMQIVKKVIDRAGRPEYRGQVLSWNWDSRDALQGRTGTRRELPTLEQLQRLLDATDLRGRTWIWTAVGLGFGQKDLSDLQTNHIDADGYDLRRGKTGIERFGSTPPIVWAHIKAYKEQYQPRKDGLMFVTRNGMPLVHGRSNSVTLWWQKLRKDIGETSDTLPGFYSLRHLGATEYGSRPGCSISDVRRWLGHATSSRVADIYMRPVAPEHKPLVTWARAQLWPTPNNPVQFSC